MVRSCDTSSAQFRVGSIISYHPSTSIHSFSEFWGYDDHLLSPLAPISHHEHYSSALVPISSLTSASFDVKCTPKTVDFAFCGSHLLSSRILNFDSSIHQYFADFGLSQPYAPIQPFHRTSSSDLLPVALNRISHSGTTHEQSTSSGESVAWPVKY